MPDRYQSAEAVRELRDHLRRGARPGKVLVGFDGCVDSIVRPVRRRGEGGAEYFATIDEFGRYLSGKAGKSCSVELELRQEKSGGNMVNCAGAMGALGASVVCLGAMGYPQVKPVFQARAEQAEVFSVANPAACTALEFGDGKVMLFQNGELDQLDYSLLTSRLDKAVLRRLLLEADALSFMNWSELQGATSLWRGLLELAPFGEAGWQRKLLLTDLSDCSRRSDGEIREFLELLRAYSAYVRLVLSLNANEAEVLGRTLDCGADDPGPLVRALHRRLGVDCVVIHLLDGCVGCAGGELFRAAGHRVESPLISTGGGDHFNAGLGYGLMTGMPLPRAMLLGNVVSELFVTTGVSPGIPEVIGHLNRSVHQ